MCFNHTPLLFSLIFILPSPPTASMSFSPNPNLQITQLLQNG